MVLSFILYSKWYVCYTGVSLPDHEVLHHHLRARLGADVTPHIVSLRSHDCASGDGAIHHHVLMFLFMCRNECYCEGSSPSVDGWMDTK